MLVTLNVKNFAIIDNVQIDFSNGFTVLTGKTGAGKSLIIDAISLLFGERASNDLIRFGENKATIEGVFSNYDAKIIEYLNEFGIDYDEDDNLLVKRELYQTGKSICKINNQTVTLNQLKQISEYIGDIHSQLETFGLINPKNYLSFLKSNEIDKEIICYNESLKNYRKKANELKDLISKMDENMQKQDFLLYQVKELDLAKLDVTEEENLQNELKVLENSENLKELITSLKDIYNGDVVDKIYESLEILKKLAKYDTRFNELYKLIESAYYDLDTASSDKLLTSSSFEFDENRFEEINNRLQTYSDLRRKYKKTTEELILYLDEIKKDLSNIENFDVIKADLENEVKISFNETLISANKIRMMRLEKALEIEKVIIIHLSELELNNAKFAIEFNEIDEKNINFLKDGIDEIDFKVSFNKGEPLKSLAKTASGGELSRFMLALKTVLGDNLPMQTKIFDEIDSGVSGKIAYAIGKKLLSLSKSSQVLCITHLPQVASLADNHLFISKVVEDGRTYTKIKLLNGEERIYEIASMISNGKPSEASINYAKEMLNDK